MTDKATDVTVTQADRKAAADAFDRDGGYLWGQMHKGNLDDDPRVKAFADHRTASEQPASGEVEKLREALERIATMTPVAASASTARDLHLTVKAIAESALSTTSEAPAQSGDAFGLTDDEAWEQLVNFDDRTSPAEYPDMALITREELSHFMRSSAVCELGEDMSGDAGEGE